MAEATTDSTAAEAGGAPVDTPQVDGPIEKAGGDSYTSFDDFEAHEAFEERAADVEAQSEVKKEAKKEAIKGKPADEKQAEEKKPDEPDEKDEDASEDDEELAAKEEKEPTEKEKEAQEKEDSTPAKELEFKVGDQTVKLREDAVIQVKVDGEHQDVTVAELRDSWSGHNAVNKRFNMLNEATQGFRLEQNNFKREREALDNHINEIHELAQSDPETAILKAVELIGGDPDRFMEDLKTRHQEEMAKLEGMSEVERVEYRAQQQAEIYKKRAETLKQQAEARERTDKLQTSISELTSKHGIDDSTFDDYAEQLIELKNQGRINQELSPEFIVQQILTDRKFNSVEGILKEIDDELAGNQGIVRELVNISLQNPNWTDEDLRSVIVDAYGDRAKAQIVSQRQKKHEPRKPTVGQVTGSPQHEDLFNFDQL
jgi:hypothetical protein